MAIPYLDDSTVRKPILPGADDGSQTIGSTTESPKVELPSAAAPSFAMPDGIDPALAAIYQQAGQNPAGRGTGFADWQYWQGVGPSQYSRLAADIAGRGPDQTTGTPWGAGAWQSSGQGGNAPRGGGFTAIPNIFGGLSAGLQSDPTANISHAMGQIGSNGYLSQLIAALRGGG